MSVKPVIEASEHVCVFFSREVQLSGSSHARNVNGPMESKLNEEGNEATRDNEKVAGSMNYSF